MNDSARRPVLTSRILTEDLPVLLKVADSEIEYLQSRLADEGTGVLAASLRPGMAARLEHLTRSRAWLASTIGAIQEKRAKGV